MADKERKKRQTPNKFKPVKDQEPDPGGWFGG